MSDSKTVTDQRPRMEAYESAELAMDTVIRTIRVAGSKEASCESGLILTALTPSDPAGSGVYNSLAVEADWNPADCTLNGVDENVKFSVANGNFYIDAAQSEPFSGGIMSRSRSRPTTTPRRFSKAASPFDPDK